LREKLKDMDRKHILEKLSLEQLKRLAKDWWGLKPPYITLITKKKLRTKKDFINYFRTKVYSKKDLIKYIKKQSKVPVSQQKKLELLANHRCEACNKKFEVTPHVHHIIPRVEGGSNTDSNLIVLCRTCHAKAHDETYTTKQVKGFIKKRKKK